MAPQLTATQGPRARFPAAMNFSRHYFFTCSGFTFDKHIASAARHQTDARGHSLRGPAASDQRACGRAVPESDTEFIACARSSGPVMT